MDKWQEEIVRRIMEKRICDIQLNKSTIRRTIYPISITLEDLRRDAKTTNSIFDKPLIDAIALTKAVEKLRKVQEALGNLSAKRVFYDDLPSTINPFLWDKKVLKERLVIPMKKSEFEANYMCTLKFKVENIMFNDPATILFMNGKKFVSKCYNEPFNEKKGLLMCLAKAYGYTHSKIKAKLKRRGMKGNQSAELCLLYDIAEKNGYSESEIDKLVEQYKNKIEKEKEKMAKLTETQKACDKKKYLESLKAGKDLSGAMKYCNKCSHKKEDSTCDIPHQERVEKSACARAYNKKK